MVKIRYLQSGQTDLRRYKPQSSQRTQSPHVVSVRPPSRSVTLWLISRKPPGLIFQLRSLTTEAQSSQRRSTFLSIQPKKAHTIASGIVVSVVRPLCALRLCGFIPVNHQDSVIANRPSLTERVSYQSTIINHRTNKLRLNQT